MRQREVALYRGVDDRGFTMAETLVVAVLFAIVGTIVTLASTSGLHHQTQLQDRNAAITEVRTALQRIDRDIRSANPLLAASSSQIVLQEVEPTVTRTVTYAVSGSHLVASETDKTTAGVTTTTSKTLLSNLVSTTTPVFSVTPTLGYTAANGVNASTCAMSVGYDPGCVGTITVRLTVQPSTLKDAVSVSDNGTELRNS